MKAWVQIYDPIGDWRVSTLLAALPVLVLLGLLASGKAPAWLAAIMGLLVASLVAVAVFRMPADLALTAAAQGAIFALFKIVWLIVAAVFLYDIAVDTGQFEVMKTSIAQLSSDRRVQAILVAFAFGAFIEGAAGFGAPVAISAAFLVGLGFEPFRASLLCLIANTAPVAWGAIGTPIKTLALVTGLDVETLSAMSGRILPPISFLVPIWLVCTMSGWRATIEVWPALVVVGGTFSFVQWAWSNSWFSIPAFSLGSVAVPSFRLGSVDLVDISSAVASLFAGLLLLRFWKPRTVWRFAHERGKEAMGNGSKPHGLATERVSRLMISRAWMPFALLSLTVLLWGIPQIKTAIDASTSWKPAMPRLHLAVAKGAAVTGHEPTEKDREPAVLDIAPISSTGTAVFLAALFSGALLGVSPVRLARLFALTLRRLVPAMVTIFAMLALGFVTRYSGLDAVLGLAFTRTGPALYPVFGTLLGWLGVALTGSDTSSNVLFGNLQRITAEKLGLSPILMASANTTGGVMGKMIDAQSIVVAAAATGEGGHEGRLLRAVAFHSIALALLVGAIVWLYAHVFTAMVPTPP